MSGAPTAPVSPEYLAEYHGDSLVACAIAFMILETVFLCLRFCARRIAKTPFGLDDAIMPFAWIVNMGLCAVSLQSVYTAGVGRHLLAVVRIDPYKITAWAKSLYAVDLLYLTSAALPKLAIILLYLRIFTKRWQRRTCYALIAVVIVNWAVYVIAASLQCTPFAYQWDKSIRGGHCFNISAYYQSTSVPNIVTDLFILVLPLPTVWILQISLLRKLGLTTIFLLGSLGIVAACVRMATFFSNNAFVDNTWVSVPLMAWTLVEPGTYLIAACMLAMRPLLEALPLPACLSRLASKRGSTYPGHRPGLMGDQRSGNTTARGFIELRSPHKNTTQQAYKEHSESWESESGKYSSGQHYAIGAV